MNRIPLLVAASVLTFSAALYNSVAMSEELSARFMNAEAELDRAWEAEAFGLRNAMLVETIEGLGQYSAREGGAYQVGDTVTIYAEPVAYGYRNTDGEYSIEIDASISLSTPTGQNLGSLSGLESVRKASRNKIRDIHVATVLTVPELPAGSYEITFTLDDLVGGQTTSRVFEISVLADE